LKEDLKTKKEKRQEDEGKQAKDGKDVFYPSYDNLKEEGKEEAPYLLLTILNDRNEVVRKIKTSGKKGVSRITWDGRYASSNPVNLNPQANDNPFQPNDVGMLVAPGKYTVSLSKSENGVTTDLSSPQAFEAKALPGTTLPSANRPAMVAWQRQVAELQRSYQGVSSMLSDANSRIKYAREAVFSVSQPNQEFTTATKAIDEKLRSIGERLNGDPVANRLDIDKPPSIATRLFSAVYDGNNSTSDPTTTMKDQLQIASEEFESVLQELKAVIETDLKALEQKLEAAGAPYTPGRLPVWKKTDN
jgi:hypothetical protein